MSKILSHPKYQGAEWTVYENTINSSAKQKFSFPKSDRFKNKQLKPINDKVSYDLPSTLIGRATSFGFGERNHVDSKRQSPSPDSYDIKIGFDSLLGTRRNNNKSFCFATGRDAYEKVFLPAKQNIPDPIVPGPGTYYYQKQIGHDRRKFSLKPRLLTGDPSELEKKKNVPGPGYYPNRLQIDKYGKYVVSSFYNSKAPSFSPTERFKTIKLEARPGPGYYEPPGQIDHKCGFQIVSNFHTVKVRKFGTSQRTVQEPMTITPGPGTYRPPSDFGYLDFKPKTGYTPSARSRLNNSTTNNTARQVSMDFLSSQKINTASPQKRQNYLNSLVNQQELEPSSKSALARLKINKNQQSHNPHHDLATGVTKAAESQNTGESPTSFVHANTNFSHDLGFNSNKNQQNNQQ